MKYTIEITRMRATADSKVVQNGAVINLDGTNYKFPCVAA